MVAVFPLDEVQPAAPSVYVMTSTNGTAAGAADLAALKTEAEKIGDDALQSASGRAVVPDSFTHGSSAQRQRWFEQGLKTGSVKGCDTFSTKTL